MQPEFTCTFVSPASPKSLAKPACKPQHRCLRCNNAENTISYDEGIRFFPGPLSNRGYFLKYNKLSIHIPYCGPPATSLNSEYYLCCSLLLGRINAQK